MSNQNQRKPLIQSKWQVLSNADSCWIAYTLYMYLYLIMFFFKHKKKKKKKKVFIWNHSHDNPCSISCLVHCLNIFINYGSSCIKLMHIVACQVHPALVKRSRVTRFYVNVHLSLSSSGNSPPIFNGLKGSGPVSCRRRGDGFYCRPRPPGTWQYKT